MVEISGTELRMVSPMIIVTIVGIAVLMLQVFHRSDAPRRYLAWMSILGLGVAGADSVYLLVRGADEPHQRWQHRWRTSSYGRHSAE